MPMSLGKFVNAALTSISSAALREGACGSSANVAVRNWPYYYVHGDIPEHNCLMTDHQSRAESPKSCTLRSPCVLLCIPAGREAPLALFELSYPGYTGGTAHSERGARERSSLDVLLRPRSSRDNHGVGIVSRQRPAADALGQVHSAGRKRGA
jgi:hypothetical protein